MKLSFTLTPDEVYEAQKLNYFKSFGFYFLTVAGLTALFVALSIFFATDTLTFTTVILLSISIFALTYPWFFLRYFAHSINYEKTPSLKGNQQLDIDEEGVKVEAELNNSKLAWKSFRDFKFNKKVAIMYMGPNAFYVVPRKEMNEEEWQKTTSFILKKIKTP